MSDYILKNQLKDKSLLILDQLVLHVASLYEAVIEDSGFYISYLKENTDYIQKYILRLEKELSKK